MKDENVEGLTNNLITHHTMKNIEKYHVFYCKRECLFISAKLLLKSKIV